MGDLVDEASVYKCTGSPLPQDIEFILRSLLEEDFSAGVQSIWELMSEKGLALQDILKDLRDHIIYLDVKDRMAHAMLVASLCDLEHRLSLGSNDKMQHHSGSSSLSLRIWCPYWRDRNTTLGHI